MPCESVESQVDEDAQSVALLATAELYHLPVPNVVCDGEF